MIRVCFVCLGNICRSPTGEAVFRKFVQDANLSHLIAVDSAGTAAYHVGEPSDARSRSAGQRRGYDLNGRARQFTREDFAKFEYVLAADQDNLRALRKLAPDAASKEKVRLVRSFDPTAESGAEVPDPYYGGADGFNLVIDICERACRGLLDHIKKELGET
jgi:protein-tyrosine phosphatase